MNGFIKKTVAALSLAGSLGLLAGCHTSAQERYYNLVDPCWPQRYGAMAAKSVDEAFAAQVNNGHVLDQTIWNYHFKPGTAELTPAAMQHLNYLARRRPAPDPKVFLQTAFDVRYDPANPEDMATQRAKLDNERVQAIQRYLTAQTSGRPIAFDVTVHDPSEVGINGLATYGAYGQLIGNYKGVLPVGGILGGLGGGGGAQ